MRAAGLNSAADLQHLYCSLDPEEILKAVQRYLDQPRLFEIWTFLQQHPRYIYSLDVLLNACIAEDEESFSLLPLYEMFPR